MNNIEIICDILTSISTLFTAIICYVTCKTYNAKFKQIRKQSLPNLQILSIKYSKSNPNDTNLSNGRHCRIKRGSTKADINISNNIASFESTDKQIEDGFISELESHISNHNDAYFTYLGSYPYLILNHATDNNSYIIDHSNTQITLHNFGAVMCAMSVKSILVEYNDPESKDLFLIGNEENKIMLSPDDNDELILYLDEVTTDLNNSLCKVSEETFNVAPDSFDLLKTHMPENILQYKKMIIELNCWNLYYEKHILQITVEYNEHFLISSTTVLK